MKKLLSLALALALCLSLTAPALAAAQPGDTTATDAKGNLYTLSEKILYTISPSDLDAVEMPGLNPGAEEWFGRVKKEASIICAIPRDTLITAPNGIRFDCAIGAFIEEEDGALYCSEYEIGPGPGWSAFQLEEGWEGALFMLPCYTTKAAEPDTSVDFVDSIGFFVPLDEAGGNPFGSSPAAGAASDKPAAPAAPAVSAKPAASKFTDVAADSPYADAIGWAVAQGITNGKTETTFGTKDICTISHILTFLWRANGKPGAKAGEAERDSMLRWAKEQGVAVTSDMLPSPCTRARAVNFMWMAAGKPQEKATTAFTDVSPDDFTKGIAWAVENGITQGTSATTFSPDNICTRAQIVTFLYRAFK